MPGGMMQGNPNAMRPGQGTGPGATGGPGGPNPGAMQAAYAEQMKRNQANQQGGPGGPQGPMGAYAEQMRRNQGGAQGGYPGMIGPGGPAAGGTQGPAGLAQGNGPADTRTPRGAVNAFLSALQAKDRDRLAEATALRSHMEAATDKNKELFGKIVDLSISDAELDDLAKKLQGFRISGENAAKSTRRLGIYVDKPSNDGGVLRYTLTVREEKKGWGVVDMTTKPIEFKPMNMNPRRKAATKGGP